MTKYRGNYDLHGYPMDWAQISRSIRVRAGDRCEKCGIGNREPHPETGREAIIQVAHLDHNKANCSDENLRALCHRCHAKHDRYFRAYSAKKRRESALYIEYGKIPKRNDVVTFDKYLQDNGDNPLRFSERHGITLGTTYSAANGQRIGWESAKKISLATNGAVSVESLVDPRSTSLATTG